MFHDFSYGGLAWHAYTQGALPTVTALPSLGELFVHVPGLCACRRAIATQHASSLTRPLASLSPGDPAFGLSLDPAEGGAFTAVELPTPPGRRKGGFRSMFSGGGESGRPRVVDALAGDGTLLLFQEGGSELTVLDLAQRVSCVAPVSQSLHAPTHLHARFPVGSLAGTLPRWTSVTGAAWLALTSPPPTRGSRAVWMGRPCTSLPSGGASPFASPRRPSPAARRRTQRVRGDNA